MLGFERRVATRFLREGRMQTLLIIVGVAAGVAVVAYISALITGLQRNTIEKTLGAQAHLTLSPRDDVVLAARATVLGHLRGGAGVQVGASSLVTEDVPPGRKMSGTPAVEHGRWLRSAVAVRDLPALLDRVRSLERRVMELERAGAPDDPPEGGPPPPAGAGRVRDR